MGVQVEILEGDGEVQQIAMLLDPEKDGTHVVRLREDAYDYRYFPDLDLLPVTISDGQLQKVKKEMPELLKEMVVHFVAGYSVPGYDARLLTASHVQVAYFEEAAKADGQGKLTANWMDGELAAAPGKEDIELVDSPIVAPRLVALVGKVAGDTLGNKLAKKVFEAMWAEPKVTIVEVTEKHGL